MKYYNFLTNAEVRVNTKQYDFNLEMAEKLSTRSKDQNTKVGCIITDVDSVIVSSGYNGPNRHAFDSYYNFTTTEKETVLREHYKHLGVVDRKIKLSKNPFMIHAEMNAILSCSDKKSLDGSIVFVTHYCCVNCLNSLIQSKVGRIVMCDKKHSKYAEMLPDILFLLENSEIPRDFILVQRP